MHDLLKILNLFHIIFCRYLMAQEGFEPIFPNPVSTALPKLSMHNVVKNYILISFIIISFMHYQVMSVQGNVRWYMEKYEVFCITTTAELL